MTVHLLGCFWICKSYTKQVFLPWWSIFLFLDAPTLQLDYYYSGDPPSWNNSPDCLYNKKLSGLYLKLTKKPSSVNLIINIDNFQKRLINCKSIRHFLWLIYVYSNTQSFPLLQQEHSQNLHFEQNNWSIHSIIIHKYFVFPCKILKTYHVFHKKSTLNT